MREILVIKPSSFGDIIHGLQVMNEFRHHTKARITWLVRDIFYPIVAVCDAVDDVLIFERGGSVATHLKLLKAIRSKHYNDVIDLQGLARSGIWTLAAKSPNKIGRIDAREGARLAYTSLIPLPKKENPHALEILLELLPLFGIPATLTTTLTFGKARPSACMSEQVCLEEPYVAVFPESRRLEKVWPYFDKLIEQLYLTFPQYKIILIGNSRDERFDGFPKNRVTNLMGKTSLVDLIPLIEKASLVITNDSGPMHLAAAMQAPVLALFGPTKAWQFGPYPLSAFNHCVLQSPSLDIGSLTVAKVVNAMEGMLEEKYETIDVH